MYQLKKLQHKSKKRGGGVGRKALRKKNTFHLTLLHVKHHPKPTELNKQKEK